MSDPAAGPEHQGVEIFETSSDAGVAPADDVVAELDRPRRPRWLGGCAGALAILMVVTWATALACTLGGMLELGVGLSYSAILLSGLAVLVGIVAVIGNWGRGWGIAGIVVGVLLNPVVLLYALSWIGAL